MIAANVLLAATTTTLAREKLTTAKNVLQALGAH
jgi:hypothetical protein